MDCDCSQQTASIKEKPSPKTVSVTRSRNIKKERSSFQQDSEDLKFPTTQRNKGNFCPVTNYRAADKSLARPGRKRTTATEDFDFHMSYL